MGIPCCKGARRVEPQRPQEADKQTPDEAEVRVAASDAGGDIAEVLGKYTSKASLIRQLRGGAVRLVKAEFLINQFRNSSDPLPCRQDCPEAAFLNTEALSQQEKDSLAIIVISYCWLSPDHPDPNRYHLEALALLLELYCRSAFETDPDEEAVERDEIMARWLSTGCDLGGRGRPVAVFLDWVSLYQDKPAGRRCGREEELFGKALQDINTWYAHSETLVWALIYSHPPGVERPSYDESGWTTFERAVACITKAGPKFLKIDDDAYGRLGTAEEYNREYNDLEDTCMDQSRGAPRTPDAFNQLIQGKTVTNGAEVDNVLKPKYAQTFRDVIQNAGHINLTGCHLDDAAARETLRIAKEHIPRLRTLVLAWNAFTLDLAEISASCANLMHLDLTFCEGIGGDLAALSPLVQLTALRLTLNEGICGDLVDLSPLVRLTTLVLDDCQGIRGDISALSPLVRLTTLSLQHQHGVRGNVTALLPLVRLTLVILMESGVTGDAAALTARGCRVVG